MKELKITQEFFKEVHYGNKTAELRLNDRDFQRGDFYMLREVDGNLNYTGNQILIEITHVLKDYIGLLPNYCVFSFIVFFYADPDGRVHWLED